MSDNRKAFEIDAEPYGFDLTLADCGCCTYADEATEYRFKGWQVATEQSSKEIERLNALVAMQAEALKVAADEFMGLPHSLGYDITHVPKLNQALSTSPESIAAWEAEKLFPLRRQVAMLVHLFTEWRQDHLSDHQLIEAVIATNTQATAEAYDRERAAKVLEDVAKWFDSEEYVSSDKNGIDDYAENQLRRMAANLRSANKKETTNEKG